MIITTLSKEEIEYYFTHTDFEEYRIVKPIVIEKDKIKSEYYDEQRTELTVGRL